MPSTMSGASSEGKGWISGRDRPPLVPALSTFFTHSLRRSSHLRSHGRRERVIPSAWKAFPVGFIAPSPVPHTIRRGRGFEVPPPCRRRRLRHRFRGGKTAPEDQRDNRPLSLVTLHRSTRPCAESEQATTNTAGTLRLTPDSCAKHARLARLSNAYSETDAVVGG